MWSSKVAGSMARGDRDARMGLLGVDRFHLALDRRHAPRPGWRHQDFLPEFRSHVPAFVEGAAWAFLPLSFVALGTVVLVIRALSRPRNLFAVPITKPGSIEIFFKSDAPYEVSDVQHHHVLSTVRIGLHNIGGTPLRTARCTWRKSLPEPALPGGLPILLEGGNFTLRHDDPEKLVDIASHWDHVEQYRFNAPLGVGFAETLQFTR